MPTILLPDPSLGQSLFIPNARLSSASLKQFYGLQFQWPVRGRISGPSVPLNPFTGLRTFHSAVDIVVNIGSAYGHQRWKGADTGTIPFSQLHNPIARLGLSVTLRAFEQNPVKEGSYILQGFR
jgi:murein DD-endopeptidase MepM/ murein hydrolase activator NlpD